MKNLLNDIRKQNERIILNFGFPMRSNNMNHEFTLIAICLCVTICIDMSSTVQKTKK